MNKDEIILQILKIKTKNDFESIKNKLLRYKSIYDDVYHLKYRVYLAFYDTDGFDYISNLEVIKESLYNIVNKKFNK